MISSSEPALGSRGPELQECESSSVSVWGSGALGLLGAQRLSSTTLCELSAEQQGQGPSSVQSVVCAEGGGHWRPTVAIRNCTGQALGTDLVNGSRL